jgi:polysaccharide biosynthesis/export protein
MKNGLSLPVLCLATFLAPVASGMGFAQESAASAPPTPAPASAPQHFAVEDRNAVTSAASDPMMGWSEPRGFKGASVFVSRGRYGTGLGPVINTTLPVRVADVGEFVSDDNMSATVRNLALEASRLTHDGLKLAAKGAVFSARVKFVGALELIADARDARHQTLFHSRALTAGLVALREADDFSCADGPTAAGCDPVALAAGHSTPLIKFGRPNSVTRLQALQLYYSYATSQLAAAVAGVPEASMALYYLGRMQPYLGESIDRAALLADAKSMALQQAAMLVDAQNYRAANELGVLLVHCGQLEQARKALDYSASICHRPEVLQNLAIVYRRLGDEAGAASLTAMAKEGQRRAAEGQSDPSTRSMVYLVDHKTFDGGTSDTPASTETPASAIVKTADNRLQYGSQQPSLPAPPAAPWAQGPAELVQPLSWEIFAQGEYIGPARTQHVPEYYLRVDDQIGFVFRVNGKPTTTPYRLNVGDVIRIGSLTMPNIQFDTPIQPDGTIILPQVGSVMAAGKSMETLRKELDERYHQFLKEPSITVVPLTINRNLEELRSAISNRSGIFAGQAFHAKVSPNGTVQLPAIGSVPAQGFTLGELRTEIETRYAEVVQGFEVTPVLTDRAPRAVYVLGEVQKPGRYPLEAPTTVIQAIAMAGSWNIGANLRQVVIFRRDEEWRLMATRVCVRPALYNSRSLKADDIWLRDSDIVIVPKCPLQVIDDYINLIFTKGVYGVVPFTATFGVFKDISSAATTVL